MSKKAGFKDLSRELAACGDACQAGVSGSGYLIARFVRDIPDNEWQEFCKTYSLSQWFALHDILNHMRRAHNIKVGVRSIWLAEKYTGIS